MSESTEPKPKMEYKVLSGMESLGRDFLGIRVMVMLSREFTSEDETNASRCVRQLSTLLQKETARLDPQTEVMKAKEKGAFEHAFTTGGFPVIFMEAIPNEYWGDDAIALSSPWYLVTTPKGHFKVGWRKRVIVLDWERSTIQASADQTFPTEDTTKGDRMIHCWSYEKLAKYLTVLNGG